MCRWRRPASSGPSRQPPLGSQTPFRCPGAHSGAVAHALPVAASAAHRSRPVVLLAGLAVLGFVALAASAAATLPPEAARHPRVDAYYLAIGAAFLSYVAALLVLLRARAPLAPVLVIAALVQAIPLASPLLLSQDAGAYWTTVRSWLVESPGTPESRSSAPLPLTSLLYPLVAGDEGGRRTSANWVLFDGGVRGWSAVRRCLRARSRAASGRCGGRGASRHSGAARGPSCRRVRPSPP